MDEKRDIDREETVEKGDELDDAVINADDTGMLAQQHLLVEEEVLLGTEGETAPEEP